MLLPYLGESHPHDLSFLGPPDVRITQTPVSGRGTWVPLFFFGKDESQSQRVSKSKSVGVFLFIHKRKTSFTF